jgi:hypothetical protein
MSLTPGVARGHVGSAAINAALDDAVRADGFSVAGLPAAADHKGKLVFCSNGATGSACLAYSDGTSWLRLVLGAAVSASA